jgi:hypothetical protein
VFDPGEIFLERLTKVAASQTIPPRPAPVMFVTTIEALAAKDKLLFCRYPYGRSKGMRGKQRRYHGGETRGQ